MLGKQMPRAPRTQLLLKREKIMREIKYLKDCINIKEEELEEVSDIIRIKGPYLRPTYQTITKLNGCAKSQPNVITTDCTDDLDSITLDYV